jgi:hypothetical protein
MEMTIPQVDHEKSAKRKAQRICRGFESDIVPIQGNSDHRRFIDEYRMTTLANSGSDVPNGWTEYDNIDFWRDRRSTESGRSTRLDRFLFAGTDLRYISSSCMCF